MSTFEPNYVEWYDGILGASLSAEVFLTRLGINFILKQCFNFVNSLL